MGGMRESCTVCGRNFEVQFRYQMEERDDAFSFFCSQGCHGKSLRGETTSGVVCTCCNKRFVVELVSQVLRMKGEAHYACSDSCRTQLLAEASGQRLGAVTPIAGAVAPVAFAPPSVGKPSEAYANAKESSGITSLPGRIAGPSRLAIFNHKGGT